MADDVVTPLNLPFMPIEEEKLEKTSFDVNIFQWLRDEKLFERVVRIQVDRSAWGR